MTEKEEVPTRFGEIEVETVECDSCGTTIAEENANEFQIKKTNYWVREGYACEMCTDEGPASFPSPDSFSLDFEDPRGDNILFFIGLFPITMVMMPSMAIHKWMHGDTHDDEYWFLEGFSSAVLGAALWGTFILCLHLLASM